MNKFLTFAFLFLVHINLGLFIVTPSKVWAQERDPSADDRSSSLSAPNPQIRPYAGGRDEEDLKVRETLPPVSAKMDRRTIEAKVIKNYSKKIEMEPSEAQDE